MADTEDLIARQFVRCEEDSDAMLADVTVGYAMPPCVICAKCFIAQLRLAAQLTQSPKRLVLALYGGPLQSVTSQSETHCKGTNLCF